MRSGATCRRLPLFLLLFVVSLISSGVPIVYARTMPRVGEITLTPTHAVPGTLVTFQGVGWYLPVPWGYGYGPPIGPEVLCQVNGEPVKIDRHCICNVISARISASGGEPEGEPVGTFVVKNVPAGDYSIFIDIQPSPYGAWLTGEATFTVDAITTAATIAATTLVTSVTSHTSILTRSASPASVLTVTATMTTTKTESLGTPQLLDYITVLAPSIVTVCLVVIFAVFLLRKGTASSD